MPPELPAHYPRFYSSPAPYLFMQVILDIARPNDWATLEPMVAGMGIRFSVSDTATAPSAPPEQLTLEEIAARVVHTKENWDIIRRGGVISNIEEFMKDFEESRKDRPLPFRD